MCREAKALHGALKREIIARDLDELAAGQGLGSHHRRDPLGATHKAHPMEQGRELSPLQHRGDDAVRQGVLQGGAPNRSTWGGPSAAPSV